MLWTMLFIYPFMAAIQEISGRLGRITRRGITRNVTDSIPMGIAAAFMHSCCSQTSSTSERILAQWALAVNLLIGGPSLVYCVVFAVISVLLQVFIPYRTYSAVLKWLTLSLFAYVGTVFVTRISWTETLRGTFLPTLLFNRESMAALIAVLGTTISPYLFFWQSAEEAEQMLATPRARPLREGSRKASESRCKGSRSIPILEWLFPI